MAYTEADTRAKLIDPQIKSSDWLSSLIKLSGMDMRELKEAFALDGVNTREGYFGLQREIYR